MSPSDRPEPGRARPVIDFARNRAEELAELQSRVRALVTACIAHNQPPDPAQLRKLGLGGQRAFYRALVQALRGEIAPATPAPPTRTAAPRPRAQTGAVRPELIASADWAEKRCHRAALSDRTMVEAGLLAAVLVGLAALSFHLAPLP
ncbi:hypothetical protein [Methylobacterium oryzae]|uniref:hypothetical protein n=1 Tax=Methylobacterium oryzae TaxID=334852 RepID=UPI001F15F611|nr:hypothetical protein [Methylobacterium oryzae]UIN38439.1 hypothetical protein LXM90_31600 [Methylobacterium oryzae]